MANSWWDRQKWWCVCQGDDLWQHVHRSEGRHGCARCGCDAYRERIPEDIAIRILIGPVMTSSEGAAVLLGKAIDARLTDSEAGKAIGSATDPSSSSPLGDTVGPETRLTQLLEAPKDSSTIHYDEDYIPHGACSDPVHCDCMCPRCWELKADIVRARLAHLEGEREKPERLFPVQQADRRYKGAPYPTRIPWSVADLAYSRYSSLYGRDQSLERMAERGGFHPEEMDEYLPDWRWRCSEITIIRAERDALQVRLDAAERERDEYKALASVGSWHKDCRPNRHMAAQEIQKSQAVINKLADTIAERDATLAQLRTLQDTMRKSAIHLFHEAVRRGFSREQLDAIASVTRLVEQYADQLAALLGDGSVVIRPIDPTKGGDPR